MSQQRAAGLAEFIESKEDLRLIEAGFPCHQVGAETQRERKRPTRTVVTRLFGGFRRRGPDRAARWRREEPRAGVRRCG
jgi:hypothetical protein